MVSVALIVATAAVLNFNREEAVPTQDLVKKVDQELLIALNAANGGSSEIACAQASSMSESLSKISERWMSNALTRPMATEIMNQVMLLKKSCQTGSKGEEAAQLRFLINLLHQA